MSMAVKEAVLPRPAVLPQSQGLLSRQRPAQVSAAPRELSMVSAAALHSSLPLLVGCRRPGRGTPGPRRLANCALGSGSGLAGRAPTAGRPGNSKLWKRGPACSCTSYLLGRCASRAAE